MSDNVIKVDTEEVIKHAKALYLVAEIYADETDKRFIATVKSAAKELERTAMLLRDTVKHLADVRGNQEPKPLLPTNVPEIGKCPSCGEELCNDDDTLRFCPTCGIAVKPSQEAVP